MRANLNALIADALMLAKAAVEGKLATRADASKHQGDFRKIVQGVNDTLDAVIGPMNDAARALKAMAAKDFTQPMKANTPAISRRSRTPSTPWWRTSARRWARSPRAPPSSAKARG